RGISRSASEVRRRRRGCSIGCAGTYEEQAMRWVRYHHEGSIHFRIVGRHTIAQVDGAPFDKPSRTGVAVTLSKVRLLPPVIPPTFYAAGINYVQHVRNAAARGLPVQMPKQADIGYRAVNALVGDSASIVVPADSS